MLKSLTAPCERDPRPSPSASYGSRKRVEAPARDRRGNRRLKKAVDDLQARVTCASVYNNYLNSAVLLIHDQLECGSEPTLPVMGRNDHRQPGSFHLLSVTR